MSHLEVKFKIGQVERIKQAVFQATSDTFYMDIEPLAKQLSPVTPEGLAYNEAKAEQGKRSKKRLGGTGDNRRSIDVEVEKTEDGVHAKLFTQSGHGGYLELGTSKMRAQPYLYPAFQRQINNLYSRVGSLLRGFGFGS